MDEQKYQNMSVDDLKKELESRQRQALVNQLQAQDTAVAQAAQKEHDDSIRNAAIEQYLKDNPPADKLGLASGGARQTAGTCGLGGSKDAEKYAWCKQYINSNLGGKLLKYGTWENFVPFPGAQRQDYKAFCNANSDSGCEENISAWSPDDVYCNIIWQAVHCTGQLQRLCARTCDIGQGDGLTVQIKTISKRGASDITETSNGCQCLSCTSNTFSTYSLTLRELGNYAVICERDIWDAGPSVRNAVIESMRLSWAEYFDQEIYQELETAVPGYSESVPSANACSRTLSGSCCTNPFAFDLYHAVVDLRAAMKDASYKPDYIIASASVLSYFKSLHGAEIPQWIANNVTVSDGNVTRIDGLEVVEYCGANACTNDAGEVLMIIIDSSRAVGEAFGMRPTLESERDIECNSTKYVMWAFWATSNLDNNAIGHIVNSS